MSKYLIIAKAEEVQTDYGKIHTVKNIYAQRFRFDHDPKVLNKYPEHITVDFTVDAKNKTVALDIGKQMAGKVIRELTEEEKKRNAKK